MAKLKLAKLKLAKLKLGKLRQTLNTQPLKTPKTSGASPVIAICGLFCMTTALLTGFEHNSLTAKDAPTVEQTDSAAPPPLALHRLIEANQADSTRHSEQQQKITTPAFHGVYRGISTEGTEKASYTMDLRREGDQVSGSLRTPYGKTGTIQGHVTGSTLSYEWRIGKSAGKGLALHEQGTLRGTWGYGDSAQNGGRSLMNLKI